MKFKNNLDKGLMISKQKALLNALINNNVNTEFGSVHSFDKIKTFKDFKTAIPVRSYNDYKHFINKVWEGEERVLTNELPISFLTSAGTSGEQKRIPVTKTWLNKLMTPNIKWLLSALNDHHSIITGKILPIVAPVIDGVSPNGLPVGSVTGLIFANSPKLIQQRYVLPTKIYDVESATLKNTILATASIFQNISSVFSVTPYALVDLMSSIKNIRLEVNSSEELFSFQKVLLESNGYNAFAKSIVSKTWDRLVVS